jgi:hypothetical protein
MEITMSTISFSKSFRARRKLYRKQLVALQLSCGKWEDIVYNGGEDKGTENCQLCKQFYSTRIPGQGFLDDCLFCPITAICRIHEGCNETPYTDWSSYMLCTSLSKPHWKVFDEESTRRAGEEMKFLRNLYKNWVDLGVAEKYIPNKTGVTL